MDERSEIYKPNCQNTQWDSINRKKENTIKNHMIYNLRIITLIGILNFKRDISETSYVSFKSE